MSNPNAREANLFSNEKPSEAVLRLVRLAVGVYLNSPSQGNLMRVLRRAEDVTSCVTYPPTTRDRMQKIMTPFWHHVSDHPELATLDPELDQNKIAS